jgi:hypothetical protein
MPYPNGIIGCPDPVHRVGEPPTSGLNWEDHIRWIVDHTPPLRAEQRDQLAMLLCPPHSDR